MNKKQKLVPKLRFPEFEKEGEWEIKKIEEVCDKPFSGGTPSSTNESYYGGNIPFIRSAEINKSATKLFLTQLGFENSSAKMVNKGDVLVALYGANSGDVGVCKINGAINQAILCLRSQNDNLFLYQYLVYRKNWIISTYLQGGQGNLSGDIIKSVELSFPKPKEQQKIANCLSSLDNLIEAETEKLAYFKKHKKGLLQQLFPAEGETKPLFRFSEFLNDGEWEKSSLSEITTSIFDGTHQTPKYTNKGIPFFSVENIVSGKKNKFISEEDYIYETRNNKPEFGDVLITRIGNIGMPKVIDWKYDFSIYVTLAVIKQSENFDSYFLEAYIQSSRFQSEILRRSLLEAAPCKINMDELRKCEVVLPPTKEEQQKIATCFSSIDNLITSQTKKIKTLKAHKKGLMQQLFPSVNE